VLTENVCDQPAVVTSQGPGHRPGKVVVLVVLPVVLDHTDGGGFFGQQPRHLPVEAGARRLVFAGKQGRGQVLVRGHSGGWGEGW